MYKLTFYVPSSHLESVKRALFATGAGQIGNYDSCSWETAGQGQFRALEGSTPYVGRKGMIEVVEEYKVELVCDDDVIKDAVRALKGAHPYEDPAYDVVRLEDF